MAKPKTVKITLPHAINISILCGEIESHRSMIMLTTGSKTSSVTSQTGSNRKQQSGLCYIAKCKKIKLIISKATLTFCIVQWHLFDEYRSSRSVDCLPNRFTRNVNTTKVRLMSRFENRIVSRGLCIWALKPCPFCSNERWEAMSIECCSSISEDSRSFALRK